MDASRTRTADWVIPSFKDFDEGLKTVSFVVSTRNSPWKLMVWVTFAVSPWMTTLRSRIGFGPPGMIRRRPQNAGKVAVSAWTEARRPAGDAGGAASDVVPPTEPKLVSIC